MPISLPWSWSLCLQSPVKWVTYILRNLYLQIVAYKIDEYWLLNTRKCIHKYNFKHFSDRISFLYVYSISLDQRGDIENSLPWKRVKRAVTFSFRTFRFRINQLMDIIIRGILNAKKQLILRFFLLLLFIIGLREVKFRLTGNEWTALLNFEILYIIK